MRSSMYALALVLAAEYASANDGSRPFGNLKVRSADEHAENLMHRDFRIRKHEAQVATWVKNSENPDFMQKQADILAAAKEMEANSLRRRADATNGGTAALVDAYSAPIDIGYAGNLTIGTPGQTFLQIPDTGSSDLWVPASTVSDGNHKKFTASSSSSFQRLNGQNFSVQYGLGSAAGYIGTDTVQFGGFTVQNLSIGIATSLDSQFVQQFNDGLIGMATSAISDLNDYTFFEYLISQKQINNPYFSVFLLQGSAYTSATSGYLSGSQLCLGCMASTTGVSATGTMFYVPIPTNLFAFYEIQASSINLNGNAISNTQHYAIVDTGTTNIYLPTSVASAMMATVSGQQVSGGAYIVPVSAITASTTFSWTFSTGTISVSMANLIGGYYDRSAKYYAMNIYGANTQDIRGNQIAILGDAFIKNALTVFSYSTNGGPAVGFQQLQVNNGAAVSTYPVQTVTNTGNIPTTGTFRSAGTTTFGFPTFSSAITGTARSGEAAKVDIRNFLPLFFALFGVGAGMIYVL